MRDNDGMPGIIIFFLLLSLLPFLIYGAAVYYAGRHLRVQLTQRYKLRPASALFLLAALLFNLLIAALITSAGVPFLLSLILVIPPCLGTCVLTLELLALAKCWPYRRNIHRQRRQIREYSDRLKAVTQELGRLSHRIRQVEGRYGRPLQEQAELEQIVQALCRRDAENLTLKRRQWQEEFRQLIDGELRRQKSEALAQAKAQKQAEKQIPFTIKASLLRLEELERLVGEKSETLRKNRHALERKTHEEQELQQKLAQARQELARLEATYQAFRASRIVLD